MNTILSAAQPFVEKALEDPTSWCKRGYSFCAVSPASLTYRQVSGSNMALEQLVKSINAVLRANCINALVSRVPLTANIVVVLKT